MKKFNHRTGAILLIVIVSIILSGATIKPIKVISHRTAAGYAPENTIAGIEKSIKSKAEYVEIDVQESKDGEIVLLHDSNFKRTAGIDKNVWDANTEEIKTYDVGSYFSKRYKGEKVPTLDEALKASKDKIKLLIEIKVNGHEQKSMIPKVLQLIKENKMDKECIIASLNLSILNEVKKIEPKIKTCYLAAYKLDGFSKYKDVDILGLEAKLVNDGLTNSIHEQGKRVFVWTVDNVQQMTTMIKSEIDGIITDYPFKLNDIINSNKNNK